MESKAHSFKDNVSRALKDEQLQKALGHVRGGFIDKRAQARAKLPEFDALRDQARDIKNHTLDHLDLYLERYEEKVTASGGHVHWAETAEDARNIILEICRSVDAGVVTKGKSMIAEEIALNDHLEEADLRVVETDLGEYIIQLRKEPPSHIIAPAVHLNKEQVEADFREHHTDLPESRSLSEPVELVREARTVLRQAYLDADVGITGANFLVADTGTSIIVTNEGNGDLTQSLPKVHIVIASLEKIVPTLEDASAILRVLARSATGQEFSTYTTFSTGPRRDGDPDGPRAVSCRAARQRPVRDAGHGIPGHAALHPLRRLHEPLSGLPRGRRTCLRLGLPRPHGIRPDPEPHRRGRGRSPAQRVDILRAL